MYRLTALASLLCTLHSRDVADTCADVRSVLAQPVLARSQPRHLQVEITTRCNLACLMCPRTVALARATSQAQKETWQQQMPLQRVRQIVDSVPNLQSLSLHGMGEPLTHPHLFEMVESAAARGIRVRLTTNATLLTPARGKRLVRAGLHRLIISLDGATAATYETIRVNARFDPVIENIRTLVATRRALKSRFPVIDLNVVVSRLNAGDVPQLLTLARELGVDSTMLSMLEPPEPEMAALVCDRETWARITRAAEVQARAAKQRLYVRGRVRASPGGAQPSTQGSQPAPNKKTHQCLAPWQSAVVTRDGDVMPCCNIYDRQYRMGNVFVSDFAAIWNNTKYQAFRTELKQEGHTPEACRWCPEF